MSELDPMAEMNYKPNQTRKLIFRLLLLVIFITAAVACGILSYKYVIKNQDYKASPASIVIEAEDRITVEIPMGSSTTDIAGILKKEGIIKYPFIFKVMSKINGYDGLYKSGSHNLSKKLKYDEIMLILTSNPESRRVTIPEGFTYKQMVERLESNKLIDKARFDKIVQEKKFDYKFLKDIPEREFKLEGYLFPDTYEFGINAGEEEIINKMLSRFDDKFKPEYYQKAKELGMTVDQIITLASIIEREAKVPEDKRTIAGVFYNRLKGKNGAPKKLQSCATIQYIFYVRTGKIKEIVTEKDTQVDSEYNTYKIEGLPPGPIGSPGIESIEAALNPMKTDYAYFVAKGDGSHEFSKTYGEHLAAVEKYLGN